MNNYLRAFIIGSSIFVIFPFYYIVSNFNPKKSKIVFHDYIYYAPIFLGFMNMLSLFISEKFNLTRRLSFLIMSLIVPTFITLFVILFKIYKYTLSEWCIHIILLYLIYFIIFNFVIYLLDKYV